MIFKPKGRNHYMVKFNWRGRVIRKSSGARTAKDARTIEAKIRSELARNNWGILEERRAVPTLAEYLRDDFMPFVESKFAPKPKTRDYYSFGAKSLLAANVARIKIDVITDQHGAQFASRNAHLAVATINCSLRTLRRALNLAFEWGKIERAPKITLAKGERQRDRVLTDEELSHYLPACRQPWKDAAILIRGTGMRPGECYKLRWEHVLLNGSGGFIQILDGKSRAAKRLLPMVPEVYQSLNARHEAQGRPAEGWVFPSGSNEGHLEQDTAKSQHARALQVSGVQPFEPYCLRHTALTRLGESGCDAFTLARIAGHSSITVTQRYIHPQQDAVERAFAKLASDSTVVTEGGHLEKMLHANETDIVPLSTFATRK